MKNLFCRFGYHKYTAWYRKNDFFFCRMCTRCKEIFERHETLSEFFKRLAIDLDNLISEGIKEWNLLKQDWESFKEKQKQKSTCAR